MNKDNIEILCCNEDLRIPLSENILGGTCSYITKKSPQSEKKNQDSIGIYARKKEAVFVLADGIGGHRMGDEASKLAVTTVVEDCKSATSLSLNQIYESIIKANKNIRALNVGAGSTLCVGFIQENKLTFLSTGDSIGVHFSGKGNTKTQTIDQSSAGLAYLSELFEKKEVLNSEGGNQLIYALGDEHLQLSITGPMEMNQRDHILLSSDGLTANVTEAEISQMITNGPVNERVVQLIDSATKKMSTDQGNPDDLSIILLSLGRSDSIVETEEEEKAV